MNCSEAQEWIHGYLDGELDLSRSLEIERHMGHCPICRQVRAGHDSLRSAISRSSLYYEAPAGLRRRVRSAVREAARSESPFRFRWNWKAVWVPLGAVALALLLAFPFLTRPSRESLLAKEIVSAHVRSLMPGHLLDVNTSDQHTVKPWFNGRLDFSPPVRDLAAQGFPLVGGRLDYIGDRPVASVVYRRRQHQINLFTWPSDSAGTPGVKTLSSQGYNLIAWSQNGMTFWAVSDVNPADLQEFARLLRNPS